MKLVYLLENTLIMFGPYLVFILLQSINLLTTDYLIARDINYIMYIGMVCILYGPKLVYDKYEFSILELKKGIVFMIIFMVTTSISFYILLKYINIGKQIDPVFQIDPSIFWKILIIICFTMYSFTEEYVWRFYCYYVTFGVFGLQEVNQQNEDLRLPEYGEIYLSFNYGLFYFLCSVIFINFYKALLIGIIFALVGRTLQQYRRKGIYFCILGNIGIKIPLSILICMKWFDEDTFHSIFN